MTMPTPYLPTFVFLKEGTPNARLVEEKRPKITCTCSECGNTHVETDEYYVAYYLTERGYDFRIMEMDGVGSTPKMAIRALRRNLDKYFPDWHEVKSL